MCTHTCVCYWAYHHKRCRAKNPHRSIARYHHFRAAKRCPIAHFMFPPASASLCHSCLPAYSHPTAGPLNLVTLLPWYTKLPDLGPKGYIAYGRWAGVVRCMQQEAARVKTVWNPVGA